MRLLAFQLKEALAPARSEALHHNEKLLAF
jgi:hypothetical protein